MQWDVAQAISERRAALREGKDVKDLSLDQSLLGMTKARAIGLFQDWAKASGPYALSGLMDLQNALTVAGFVLPDEGGARAGGMQKVLAEAIAERRADLQEKNGAMREKLTARQAAAEAAKTEAEKPRGSFRFCEEEIVSIAQYMAAVFFEMGQRFAEDAKRKKDAEEKSEVQNPVTAARSVVLSNAITKKRTVENYRLCRALCGQEQALVQKRDLDFLLRSIKVHGMDGGKMSRWTNGELAHRRQAMSVAAVPGAVVP